MITKKKKHPKNMSRAWKLVTLSLPQDTTKKQKKQQQKKQKKRTKKNTHTQPKENWNLKGFVSIVSMSKLIKISSNDMCNMWNAT